MNICLIYNNGHPSGCSLYRLEMPHAKMHELYGDEIQFFSIDKIDEMTEDQLRIMDLIIINRSWSSLIQYVKPVADVLRKFGAKIVLDLDDYWTLQRGHAFYEDYQKRKMAPCIIEHIKIADHITTTTKYLRDEIVKINPNCTILENVPTDMYKQFEKKPEPSDIIRFGYFGASQHLEDIQSVALGFERLAHDKSLNGKYKLYMAGYHEQNKIGHQYEEIFSGRYENDNYCRIAGTDVYSYIGGYNFVDVGLAPLRFNKFNGLKSELKVVEAAWMGKTIIATDITMYRDVIEHGVDGFLVNPKRPGDWHKYMKRMMLDVDMTREMAKRLETKIRSMFKPNDICKKRLELYKSLKNTI